ncbi:hypothetical protein [Plantactinospora endophytica]|uniref:hypothetical protein n=1 Tax=Plantactinospora endophytica TaxID=673535 RepID=UPI001941B439|nr:hypothetical protein [Plantactinospora endophytica]
MTGAVPDVQAGAATVVDGLPSAPTGIPAAVDRLPSAVGIVPQGVGVVPKVVVPDVVGAVPSVVRIVPSVVGTVPDVVGSVPDLIGAVPSVMGTVPDVVGTVPELVGEAPSGRDPDSPSPRVLARQPVDPAQAHVEAQPPVPLPDLAGDTESASVLTVLPGSPASLRQLPVGDADGAAGTRRPGAVRAIAGVTDSTAPSTPYSPVDTGPGTQQAGPPPSGSGPVATLPATAGWQPAARFRSISPHGDVEPTGRWPGVPALPG